MKTGDRKLFSEIVQQAEARRTKMEQQRTALASPEEETNKHHREKKDNGEDQKQTVETTTPPEEDVKVELPPCPQAVVDQLYLLAVFAESFRTQRRCSLVHSQVYFQHLKRYTDFYRQVLGVVRRKEKEEYEANQSSMFSYLGYAEQYQQSYRQSLQHLDTLLREMENCPTLRRDWSDMGPELNNKYPQLRFTPALFPMYGSSFMPKVCFGKTFFHLKSIGSQKDEGDGSKLQKK